MQIDEILKLDCAEFVIEFYRYVIDKKNRQVLSSIEKSVYLVLSMLPDTEMEGFADLFMQMYSQEDFQVIEKLLRQLDLNILADQLINAKRLFAVLDGVSEDDQRWREFDEIGKNVMAEGSQLYLTHQRVCAWIKAHANEFL